MRDVVRIFVFFYFLSILDTLSLVYWSCDHLVIANLVLMLIYILRLLLLSFTYLSMLLFLSSLYTYVSYLMYAILYFCFTLRCHKLSSCKVFQEFVLG